METETTPATERRAIPADTFPARLMLARLHAGNLTVTQAAERCGLLRESWSNWERGMKPRDEISTAEAISDGLGVDLHWLLWGGQLTPETRPPRRPRRDLRTESGVTTGGHPTRYHGTEHDRLRRVTKRRRSQHDHQPATRRTSRVVRPVTGSTPATTLETIGS